MTNSERVVTLCSQFREPPGEAKADWEIFAEVGRRLGFEDKFAFDNAAAVHAEFVQLTGDRPCDMGEISHENLASNGPMQWHDTQKAEIEIEENDSGFFSSLLKEFVKKEPLQGKRLYTDLRFHTPDGRARFAAYHSRGLAEPPSQEYPFVLTSGRLYGHWHTQTRTGRIEKIVKMHPHPFIEIHPRDAAKLNIQDGNWIEIKSRRGTARFPAKVTKAIAPETVFVPMHWGALWADDAEANSLTHPETCPISLQPELKACAVQLVPVTSAPQTSKELPHQEQLALSDLIPVSTSNHK